MPKQNPYLINNNKPVEEVREIPTYQPKYTDEEVAKLKEIFIAEQKEAIKKYQIKTSPLSPEARNKVIRKWGSDYVSENREDYGPGNSQSAEENVAKAGRFIAGTVLTVATVACPPAGLAAATVLVTTGSAVKGISRIADEDSNWRAAGDAFDWMAQGSVKTSAKQQAYVKILKK